MVSGAWKRAPAFEISPMPERMRLSTMSWSAPSIRSMRGPRSRNAASMRFCHKSGGSNTWESEDRMKADSMGISFPAVPGSTTW